MQKFLIIAAIALFAVALATPVVEDSWDAEDELLQRVHEDATPLTLLQKNSADEAAANAAANKAKAAAAAKVEAKEGAAEKKAAAEAAKLGKADKELSAKAAKANAAQAAKNAKDAASMVKKVEAANAASKKADADEKKNKKDTKALLAKLAKESGAAKAATAKRLAAAKAAQKTIAAKKAKAEADKKAAEEAEKKNEADLKAKTKAIDSKFTKEKAAIDAKLAAGEKKMNAEQKKAEADYQGELKKNAAKAAKAQKAVDDEAKANAKKADKEMKAIDSKYKKIDDKLKAKNAKYAAAAAKAAAALKAKRTKEAAAKEKKAKKVEADFKHTMATTVKEKDDKRDAALKKAKDYKAHTAEVQKKQEAKTKAIDAIDNELGNAMCDTTECQLPTGKCVKTKCNGGSKYYLNTDLVTCTTTKSPATENAGCANEHGMAGLKWGGEKPTPAPTFAPSSSACKAAVAAFAKKYGAVPASSSLSAVACSAKKTDRKAEIAVRAKVLMFLKVKETCPEECNGSVKVTEMDDSTHTQQNCVPQSFYTGMVSMFDLKARKKSGTGGRFTEGVRLRACRQACTAEAGWAQAAGTKFPGSSAICKGRNFKRVRLASRVGKKL